MTTRSAKPNGAGAGPTIRSVALDQPAAFRPFVGQLIVFGEIASLTSDNQIVRVISASPRKWNDVINVVAISDFFTAVIALVMLSFKLILNNSRFVLDQSSIFGRIVMSPLSKFFKPSAVVHSSRLANSWFRPFAYSRTASAVTAIVNTLKISVATCANLYRHNVHFTRYSANNQGKKDY